MDHLLRRVGFKPHSHTHIKRIYIARKYSLRTSRNSLVAYHALNVASNAIHLSFRCFMIIVYSSLTGSARAYAQELSSKCGFDCIPVGNPIDDDSIIFIGWLKGIGIIGIEHIPKERLSAVIAVGIDDTDNFKRDDILSKNQIDVPLFYVRGWIHPSDLSLFDNLTLKLLSVFLGKKISPEVREAMRHGGDFFDPSSLDPIIERLG